MSSLATENVTVRSWLRTNSRAIDYLMIVALGLVLFFPALGETYDVASNEVRHAEIAREMAASGDYLVPTLLGRTYADKPMALYAITALLYRVSGRTSIGIARVPSAVAAIVGAIAVFELVMLIDDRRTARLAALGLMSIAGYSAMARDARPDMSMVAAALLSCLCAAYGMASESRKARARFFALSGVLCATSVLIKGPIGLLVVLVFMEAAALERSLRHATVSEWMIFGGGLVIALLIWAAPAYLHDRGAYLTALMTQRDLSLNPDDDIHSLGWYLTVVPQRLLPFLLFALLLIPYVRERGWRVSLVTALVLLVVLFVIPKKRSHYSLPVYPFMIVAIVESIYWFDHAWITRSAVALSILWAIGNVVFVQLIRPRFDWANSRTMVVAPQVLKIVPNGVPIVCIGDLAEAIAFIGHRSEVVEVYGYRKLISAIHRVGRGSYAVIPNRHRPDFFNLVGCHMRLTHLPDESLSFSTQPDGWQMYRVDEVFTNAGCAGQ